MGKTINTRRSPQDLFNEDGSQSSEDDMEEDEEEMEEEEEDEENDPELTLKKNDKNQKDAVDSVAMGNTFNTLTNFPVQNSPDGQN